MKTKLVLILSALIISTFSYSQTVLFQELFDDANINSRGWYDNSKSPVISTTEHIPGSAGSVEFRFLKGAQGTTSAGLGRRLFDPSDSIYVDFWIKYSANYTGSNQPYHPHEFMITTTEDNQWIGPAYTHLTAYIEQNEGTPMLAVQDGMNIDISNLNTNLTDVTENRAVCGCNGIRAEEQTTYTDCYKGSNNMYWNGKTWKADKIYFQSNVGAYYKNDWHHIEVFFKLNTISGAKGNPDGVVRYNYDDQVIIDKTNVIMRTAKHPNMKFNQFLIAPWIGDGSPVDQSFWVDNLVVSTGEMATGIVDQQATDAMVSVFPNPSTGSIVVDFKDIKRNDGDFSFSLYDMQGKEVSTYNKISGGRLTIEKKDLTQGTYLYKVRQDKKNLASGKLIVQ